MVDRSKEQGKECEKWKKDQRGREEIRKGKLEGSI